jgi:Ni/Co efflux regulator RcnB
MKRLLCATAIIALILPDLAMAANNRTPQRPGVTRPVVRPQPQRPVRPNRPRPPQRPTPGQPGATRPVVRPQPQRPVRPVRPRPPQRPTPGRPGIRPPVVRPPVARPPVARPPVARPPRPPHRPGFRPPNFRPIHGPAFRYPRGYRYRRWTVGLLLPSLFLSNNYYYDDWYGLGFGPPPPGYRWVRYGPDLLLINIRTRRVADVVYGVFY